MKRVTFFLGPALLSIVLACRVAETPEATIERTAARLAGLEPAVDVVLPAHNEPTMPSHELLALRDAFGAMRSGDASYVLTDGDREYDFGRFSILVSDPPPWETSEP